MSPASSKFSLACPLAVVLLCCCFPAKATTLWDESVNGDLSNNGLTPTELGQLQPGINTLTATFFAGGTAPDPDYFTLEVPSGLYLQNIILRNYISTEDIAFFGLQAGSVFDFVITSPTDATGLLGWTHIQMAQVDTDILDDMGASNLSPIASGATGFTPPLRPGNYSFWLRQGSEVPVTITMDFVAVVPEPLTLLGSATAIGFGFLFKRKLPRK